MTQRNYDPKAQSRNRGDERVEAENVNAGARKAERQLDAQATRDLMEELTDADLLPDDLENSEYEGVVELLSTELSGRLATTFYDADDRDSLRVNNMARANRILLERNSGRLCKGPWAEVAQGVNRRDDKAVKPSFTSDEERVIRTAIEEVRLALQLLSIDHIGLDKIADTKIESVTKRINEGEESKGRIGRAMDKVFG